MPPTSASGAPAPPSARWQPALLLLAVFVVVERRTTQPIVPLRLFAGRERSGAYLARMLYMGAMMGFFFFTAQYVQSVYGWTPLQAGLAFLPMTLSQLRRRRPGAPSARAGPQAAGALAASY